MHHHHVIAGTAILEHPSGFASPPRAMPRHDDRAVAADRAWDREGRRRFDPRGPPQGTVDRFLQLGQTNAYQGGGEITDGEDWLLKKNIKIVVNCTMNLPRPRWVGRKRMPSWLRFPVSSVITRRGHRGGNLSSAWGSLWKCVDPAKAAGGSILIHCNAGAHRAGLTVSSISMRELSLPPKGVVAYVGKR